MNQSIINSVQLLDGVYLTHVMMEDEILTYVDNRSGTSVFHVIDLTTKETLKTIPIGDFSYSDVIYSNGQIFKVDGKTLSLYDEKECKFNNIYSKLQEESTYPDYVGNDSECYAINRVMMNKEGKAVVIRAIMEYGDCNECIVQRLQLH